MNRLINLDGLRIMSAFMIVLMHSLKGTSDGNGLIANVINYISAPFLCLFFMISGALLLPIKNNDFSFLKKRLNKIICPIIFWSFFYMILKHLIFGLSISVRNIISIPFSVQGSGVLWFMYALLGLYLIAPIISPWLEKVSIKVSTFYALIFLFVSTIPILSLFLIINTSDESYLYYFCGFIGYFYFGWYLKNYGYKIPLWLTFCGFMFSISAAILTKLMDLNLNFYSIFWYNSIFVYLMAIFWFKLFFTCKIANHIKSKILTNLILKLSNLSFGIYLTHIAIVRYVLWDLDFINSINSYVFQSLTIAILGFIISALICYLISVSGIGQYIIGYSNIRKH